MRIERTCSQCKLCPLRDRKRISSETPDSGAPFMAFLGEAPGEQEDFQGVPFVGPAGRVLNWALGQQDIRRDRCHIMNTIDCRPPDNRIDGEEGSRALACCRGGLFEELRYLKEKKVKVIVALGATAMQALEFKGAFHQYRGSVLDYNFLGWTFKVVPTFHPSAILRGSWKRDGHGKADNAVTWLSDLSKARSLAVGNWEILQENFELRPTVERVEQFVEEAIAKDKLIAVDTETTGLHYDYAKIVVIGLADSKEHGISVPLLIGENTPFWQTPADEVRVREALKKLFKNCRQVYQNCFFDIPLLRRDGFEIPNKKIEHDTILLHHTIAPEDPHKLGHIVSVFGNTPFWKAEFQERVGSIFEMVPEEMWTYNLRDCVVLHQVLEPMMEQLKNLKAEDFYRNEVVPLIDAVMEMKDIGVLIDLDRMRLFKAKLQRIKEKLERKLKADGGLPECFNLDSDDQLRWFLYGNPLSKFATLDLDLEKKKKGTKVYQTLMDLKAIRDAAPIYVLDEYRPRATETGKAGVNEQALQGYRIALNNRLADLRSFVNRKEEEEKAVERLLCWLDDLQEFAGISKLMSTYTNYKPFKDGRIHPNWKQHGTVSGRLSCTEPNLMNLPKPDEEEQDAVENAVRELFVSAEGCSLLSADYVNLEAALLAYEVLEPDLLSVFTEGKNLHDINTRSLFGIGKEDPRWPEARKAAKVFFFGGISYGGGPREIFEKVSIKAPKLRLTYAEFCRAQDKWFAEHPNYVRWKQALKEQVETDRFVTTEFGRVRFFLGNDRDILKQALDYKIQSAGASLMNRATARILDRRNDEGLRSRLILQVHDQLIFECPDEELDRMKAIQKEEMEKPFIYKGVERRIPVEQSIGRSYAEV